MPPCAATVCERVGKTLVMQAVFSPAWLAPTTARRARAAGADHHHVVEVLGDRIGAAVHRRRALAVGAAVLRHHAPPKASFSTAKIATSPTPQENSQFRMSSESFGISLVHVVLDDDLHADPHVDDGREDAGDEDDRDERRGKRRDDHVIRLAVQRHDDDDEGERQKHQRDRGEPLDDELAGPLLGGAEPPHLRQRRADQIFIPERTHIRRPRRRA